MMSTNDIENLTLEETLKKIEDVLGSLQSDSIPLEESFALYKNGMELINHCNEVIEQVEKQIVILQNGEGSEDDD